MTQIADIQPLYVNQQEAARLLSCCRQHMANLEKKPGFPKPSRIDGMVRYSIEEIKAYMASKKG